jgi:endonuclease YncB( thermonuclease family)
MRARWLLLLITALAAQAVWGQTYSGKVVRISDGDTLTVLVDHKQIKVRLTEIDAPEIHQAFGQRSKQSLDEMCAGRAATVRSSGRDKYGRILGRIDCEGIDANAEQVRRGMAWVYDRYVMDRALYPLQNEARAMHTGLWADPAPMAPWLWRSQHKR